MQRLRSPDIYASQYPNPTQDLRNSLQCHFVDIGALTPDRSDRRLAPQRILASSDLRMTHLLAEPWQVPNDDAS